ncbi:MAG: BlaI/MecI/CopY family transcriptional regulator [Syntrophomonadaceae bacterium]|nr:BlaI/MecI/CopY family transcriptional regulator [Syntrophomonadaceae bacterium]
MREIQKISESEMEVMQVIWGFEKTLTSAEILQALNQKKDWKPTTVFTFLARLAEKGIITSSKKGKVNQYIPLISESDYRQFETYSFLNTVHKGSVKSFISALYEGDGIKKEEIEELKKWFAQKVGE